MIDPSHDEAEIVCRTPTTEEMSLSMDLIEKIDKLIQDWLDSRVAPGTSPQLTAENRVAVLLALKLLAYKAEKLCEGDVIVDERRSPHTAEES